MIKFYEHLYHHDEQELRGWMALPKDIAKPCPAVMVIHDWSGCNEMAKARAQLLAEQGYIGFAVDMYGEGRCGHTNEEKQTLMQPLLADRLLLRARVLAAVRVLEGMPEVKPNALAAIGFCFGGLCALDLARAGAKIQGVISFHGLLHAPTLVRQKIHAKILVLHGYRDPMVRPQDLIDFAAEMEDVDWQMHVYGQAKHAFTNPLAHDQALGLIYDEAVAKHAFQEMNDFLQELFSC